MGFYGRNEAMWEYLRPLSPPELAQQCDSERGIASVWSYQPTSGPQEELKLEAHADVITVKLELYSQRHDLHNVLIL